MRFLRKRVTVAKPLLAVMGLIAGLLVAECILRVFYPVDLGPVDIAIDDDTQRPINRRCMRRSRHLGWEPIPGRCARNQLGLIGPEIRNLPRDALKILVVGDSLTARRHWLDVAQQKVAAKLQRAVVVENGGVSGYDTCQELGLLDRVLDQVNPDIVLVQTCVNDIYGSPVILRLPGHRAWLGVGKDGVTVPAVFLRSMLFRLSIQVVLAHTLPNEGHVQHDVSPTAFDGCLADMARLAAEPRRTFAALQFPVLANPATANPGDRRSLADEDLIGGFIQQKGYATLELRPALEAAAAKADGASISSFRDRPRDSIHLSRVGQEVVGNAVADFIADRVQSIQAPGSAKPRAEGWSNAR